MEYLSAWNTTTKLSISKRTALEQVQSNNVQQVAEGLSLEPQPATGSEQHSAETRWPSQEQMERIRQDSRLSALVGQNVVLNCAVQFKDGIEKPFVVNWLKYPHKLPIYIWYAGYPPHVAQGYEARVSRIGQASLNLSQVRESDQGLYECKIYYLDRRPEDKGSGTWIYLDVQGESLSSAVFDILIGPAKLAGWAESALASPSALRSIKLGTQVRLARSLADYLPSR